MPADRGILRPVMYQAIKQGHSFNAFYRSAQDKGITYRRADMLADWAAVRAEVESASRKQALNTGDIPEAIEVGRLQFTIPGFYYYRLRVDYIQPDIEGQKATFITVKSEDPMTYGDILRQVSEKFKGEKYESLSNVKGYEFLSAIHRPIP